MAKEQLTGEHSEDIAWAIEDSAAPADSAPAIMESPGHPLTQSPAISVENQSPRVESPIADLTYRTYDGPFLDRRFRWWVIAGAWIRQVVRSPGFWVCAALALWPYVRSVFFLYLDSNNLVRQPQGAPDIALALGIADHTRGQEFAFQLYGALTAQWFIFLIPAALIAGSGAIAADNRANALQVYLSKPITKGDYLLGKWAAVFTLLFSVTFLPQLFLFLYCALSYSGEGFFHNEPLLGLRVLGASCVPAAIHASLLIGFSAWSRTPRMAGALYAGFYFMALLMDQVVWRILYHGHLGSGELVRHFSIHGVIEGLTQNIFGLTIRTLTGHRRLGIEAVALKPPSLAVVLGLAAALIVIGIAAARVRIRAVEVIRG